MEMQARSRVAREEWAKRVERWRDSGLTCGEFASEIGVNPRTLTYWKWILGKEARGEKRTWPSRKRGRPRARQAATSNGAASLPSVISGLIELQATAGDARFELELGSGRRLRVPASFDAAELRRLLEVLEAS
jgi:hypothetical protein